MNIPRTNLNPRLRPRRGPSQGFLYVAVLFTSLIVMTAVTAALSISTSNLRRETDRSSRGEALRLAESEMHRQAALMRMSSQWRTDSTNNVFSAWHAITVDGIHLSDTSQVRHRFSDSDGDLGDDLSDSIELTVHAKVGSSEAALTATLQSDPAPMDLLRYSMTAADDIQFESGGALSCERPVQVLDDCKTGSWGILTTPQLECSGNVQMTLRGDLAASSGTLPSHDVVAKYVSLGTEIPSSNIPRFGGDLLLRDIVLSPTANPLGAVNPSGIYWIDAAGDKVIISHCRFDATLAVRNASQIDIVGAIAWSYPTTADVILAADSRIRFENLESTLDEAARNVNFNPASSPYRQTASNNTSTDTYPTELRGVIYTTNDIRLDPSVSGATLRVAGAVVGRDIHIEGAMTITQLDELLTIPPTGLTDPTPMRFIRGTIRRVPSP